MKKFSFIAALLFGTLLLQNCKKDTITATATSTAPMFAFVNGTSFTPAADSVIASITYNSAAKSKVLVCTGNYVNQQIYISITQNNATNTPGFPLGTYNVDTTPAVMFSYNTKQKNSSGVYVFAPMGTVGPGSGTVIITAVDSVKKVITGTFSFASKENNYDSNGNIISVYNAQISQGALNSMPYTFTSN